MEIERFDALTRRLASRRTRRGTFALLGGILGTPLLAELPAAAKKKKKKKTTLCLDGQTIQASKKKKKKLLKSGATPGECPPLPPPPGCTPACAGKPCGADDGCGGICGCAAGSICHEGVCQTCTVTCDGNGAACGDKLKTALATGSTVYACPGRYVGNFTLASDVTLAGAGEGDDPGANTILDANQNGGVVRVEAGVTAALHKVRITNGRNVLSGGGGIDSDGTLTATACTITANHSDKDGGGIFITDELTLDGCTVSANTAGTGGGGINSGATLTIKDTAITGNRAKFGGGLRVFGTATFDQSSSVTGNTATDPGPSGGGIAQTGGDMFLNGATVSGNTPDDCSGADCP